MVRSIVHHQNHPFRRVTLHQQFFQKEDESDRILRQGSCPGDRVIEPVIATKNMPSLLSTLPGGWNPLLLSYLHPASSQGWVQGYRRFVHKDELEIVSEDLFFNSSSTSAAWALAALSCKWPKSYFGRRYRYPFRLSRARNALSLRLIPVFCSRWARNRSIVQILKSYPNSDGSCSITSSKASVYASSAFSGRPLFPRLANSSTPPLRNRSIQLYMLGMLTLHFCDLTWLMIQMKEAHGSTPLTYFRTSVSVHSRFNGCQFLFCEVIISGFWHASVYHVC